MGATIGNALSGIDPANPDVEAAKKRAKEKNYASESNGCLMRITPLAVWCHNLPDDKLKEAAEKEDEITHPSANTQAACYLYCLCIKHLIQNPGKRMEAIEHVM